MAASSFGGHDLFGKGRSLLKKLPTRISKQHIVEQKFFGSKRKNIKLGKSFKHSGKVSLKKPAAPHMPKTSGVSPSLEEFDKMMSSVVGKKSKKSMFKKG